MSGHPALKDNPTLSDVQKYIAAAVAHRKFSNSLQDDFIMLTEEVGELAKSLRKHRGIGLDAKSVARAAEDEVADVLWMLACVCNQLGIDLEQAFRAKEEKNKSRVWK